MVPANESDTFCAIGESNLSTMEYGSLLGSLTFLVLAVYSREIQAIVFRALHDLHIRLRTKWELVKHPSKHEMRPTKISISAAEGDSVLSDMTRSTRQRSTSSSSHAEIGGAASKEPSSFEKTEKSVHGSSANCQKGKAQCIPIARDSIVRPPTRRPSVDSFGSDVEDSDVASFAESSSFCKGPGHDSMTLSAENTKRNSHDSMTLDAGNRSTDGILSCKDTNHDSHDSMTLGAGNMSKDGFLSCNDTKHGSHGSMTLGAGNMSKDRVLSCNNIENELPLSTPCREDGKRKSPKQPEVVGQSVAAQIAQNVKRKMKIRHPVLRQTSSSSSLAQNSQGLRSSAHRQSCFTKVSRLPSGSSFASDNGTAGKENIPSRNTTLQRRASIGRSSNHQAPPRRHSTDDFFSLETYVDRGLKPPVRRPLVRSTSEAIMRSSSHKTKTRISRASNKTSGLSFASQHHSSIERRGHSNTRSFLRSSSDVSSVESTSKPSPRHGAAAMRRSESSRALPRRTRSKVSNDRLPMRGCLRASSSQSSRDLSSRVLPSRGSSISSEDMKILRKVESSRNLFGL